MKRMMIALLFTVLGAPAAYAVTTAEDIATTIKLRDYDCGGRAVSHIRESQDAQGNRMIQATCPNGIRYQITISARGHMQVQPLH